MPEGSRRQGSCEHSLGQLLGQRIYALALGDEDLNDHGELGHGLAQQTANNTVETLASASALCRLEQRADRETAWAIHEVLFKQFVAAHPRPPRRLIPDFDATDTPLLGEQEDRFFDGYYGGYCYLPLSRHADKEWGLGEVSLKSGEPVRSAVSVRQNRVGFLVTSPVQENLADTGPLVQYWG